MDDDDLPKDTPWWARLLIENVRDAWKLASVWWPSICAVLAEVYAEDADQLAQLVPKSWMPHILAGAFVVSIIVRVMKQKETTK